MAIRKKDTNLRPSKFSEPASFPSISKPQIVGYFSVDKDRKYLDGAANCKYVAPFDTKRRVNFDLNHGYENVIHKIDEAADEKLDHILTFISKNLPKLLARNAREQSSKLLAADVVCFRGLLRSLMCTPYENRESWIILATKYRGTIYLCGRETDRHRIERMNQDNRTKRILSYGFKFEQYMMRDKVDVPTDTDKPVNENEEFCCVFRSRLGNSEIMYGAEMDGIESVENVDFATINMDSLNFIELKVKLIEERENQYRNYLRFKLRNWWCQSFLVNIKKILVGTRNPNGIVTQLSTLDVRSIPKQAGGYWSPSLCMEFCNQFISMVRAAMSSIDCPHTVYRFEYNPTLSDAIYMTEHKNDPALYFLPDWYTSILNQTIEPIE